MSEAEITKPQRIVSVDAFRGFVMFLMLAEVLHISSVAKKYPDSTVWQFLKFHTSHVEWTGCSLHDMIQPSFSFLVGVALPFSLASRLSQGHTVRRLILHAFWRAFLLIALGIFLRSVGRKITNFTFEDTLTQIGLGYVFLFALGLTKPAWGHWIAFILILVGYWSAFALYPLPNEDFSYAAVGVPSTWEHHATGIAAHWNKNSNVAWAFDTWFLNLFAREKPFEFNGGGYATLSFIPTLGTMILGLIAGSWLKSGTAVGPLLFRLFAAGSLCIGVGYGLDALGFCPSVKRIWTPSWTLFSGGICFLMLSGFVILFDMLPLKLLAFPLVVIGANSIFIYCISHLIEGFLIQTLETHKALLGMKWENSLIEWSGEPTRQLFLGTKILIIYWLMLFWMYRRRIFIKI